MFYDSGMRTQLWFGMGRCLEGLKTLHPWGQVSRDDSRFQDDRSLYLPDRPNLFLPLFLSTRPPHTHSQPRSPTWDTGPFQERPKRGQGRRLANVCRGYLLRSCYQEITVHHL